MRVLVVGSGGREHALVWKLAQSRHVDALWCTPGNPGIANEVLHNGVKVECNDISTEDITSLLAFAKSIEADLTVVGPDNPLSMGIVDRFRGDCLQIWGPTQNAARIESSKAFSQSFMEKHGIPTAKSGIFTELNAAKAFVRQLDGKCAVKADGLALGKGVMISHSLDEAEDALLEMFVHRTFGDAGNKVVIQELLTGPELSLHAMCDANTALLFPISHDYKRVHDNDEGLNTGGMGAYCATPLKSSPMVEEVRVAVLDRWLAGCREEELDFRGLLYPGLILTDDGPKVIEFNARFGDPETQVYMPLLKNDLVEVLIGCIENNLSVTELEWEDQSSVCVVVASGGYPGSYEVGRRINGINEASNLTGVKVFHAGTAMRDGNLVTNGGRVLGVTAYGSSLSEARSRAYEAVNCINFEGAHYRLDIAKNARV